MLVGIGRAEITPPLGESIMGYYVERLTKGVLDPLYVTAAAFSDGDKKAMIIELDVCELYTDDCSKYRKRLSDELGIDVEAIWIVCSHTHTGPVIGKNLCAGKDGTPEYESYMVNQIINAAKLAISDLKPSRFAFAKGEAKNISFSRRFRMKDGSVQTNPGVENENIDHAIGTPNETVKLVKIIREDADDIYVVNFGTHADTVGGELISGDWPAFVRETVEGALDGVKCLFLTGVQGDVGHINPFPTESDRIGLEYDSFDNVPRGYEHTKHMGRVVGGEVVKIAGKAVPISDDKLLFETYDITIPSNKENDRIDEAREIIRIDDEGRSSELPYKKMELTTILAEARRIEELYNGPDSFDYKLFAIRLGDLVFAGLPGECFVEIGRRIESESPFDHTVICCLTNGGATYFPSSSAYAEGGYEAKTSRLQKGADNIVISGMKSLFDSIR